MPFYFLDLLYICMCVFACLKYVLTGEESTVGVERAGEVTSLGKGLLGEETNEYRTEVHPRCDGDSS